MRKDLLLLAITLLVIVVIVGTASCVIGYVTSARLMSSPTSTPIPAPVVSIEEIRQVAELATVKYTMSTDVTSSRVPNDIRADLGVKEEIVLIVYGEVVAGFDLSKLEEGDLWMDGTRVQLHLPAPEILYLRIDNERTHVVYYKKSWLIDHDLDIEGKALLQAEAIIHQAALDSDVLYQASEYGKLFFANWFYSMGFTEVQIIVN